MKEGALAGQNNGAVVRRPPLANANTPLPFYKRNKDVHTGEGLGKKKYGIIIRFFSLDEMLDNWYMATRLPRLSSRRV